VLGLASRGLEAGRDYFIRLDDMDEAYLPHQPSRRSGSRPPRRLARRPAWPWPCRGREPPPSAWRGPGMTARCPRVDGKDLCGCPASHQEVRGGESLRSIGTFGYADTGRLNASAAEGNPSMKTAFFARLRSSWRRDRLRPGRISGRGRWMRSGKGMAPQGQDIPAMEDLLHRARRSASHTRAAKRRNAPTPGKRGGQMHGSGMPGDDLTFRPS
jgi:hypothetical protein